MRRVEIFREKNPMNPRDEDYFTFIAYTKSNGEFYTEYSLNVRKPIDLHMWLKDMLGQKRKTAKMLTGLKDTFNKKYIAQPIYEVEIDDELTSLITTNIKEIPKVRFIFVGYIFTTKEMIRQKFNVKRVTQPIMNEVKKILNHELKKYNSFLNNDVYGYRIFDENDNIVQENTNFFGNNWKKNGLKDEIPDDLKENVPDNSLLIDSNNGDDLFIFTPNKIKQ